MISLNPGSFRSMNEFFKKFKHLVLQLKHCKIEKYDDQLILAILSKHGPDDSVFVSTFHIGKLKIPNWKMPSLDSFIKTLTNEHDKFLPMGILRSSNCHSSNLTHKNICNNIGSLIRYEPLSCETTNCESIHTTILDTL